MEEAPEQEKPKKPEPSNLHPLGKRIKLKEPPVYEGEQDAVKIDGWIRSVERYADFQQWDDTRTGILAIDTMTDEEATDKFIRGLKGKGMRIFVRQQDDEKLNTAINAAIGYNSAEHENIPNHQQPTYRPSPENENPMDLDVMYSRTNRNRGQNRNHTRNQNQNQNQNYRQRDLTNYRCYYCQKLGHERKDCRKRRNDIKALDDEAFRNRQDFQ
ncbi:hypothetical protein K501DRAFT_270150 [Backusella circina FSU 941]|nr:hypothetical protein K501DRAFT_270150 [Backusella circina FSU 941]